MMLGPHCATPARPGARGHGILSNSEALHQKPAKAPEHYAQTCAAVQCQSGGTQSPNQRTPSARYVGQRHRVFHQGTSLVAAVGCAIAWSRATAAVGACAVTASLLHPLLRHGFAASKTYHMPGWSCRAPAGSCPTRVSKDCTTLDLC